MHKTKAIILLSLYLILHSCEPNQNTSLAELVRKNNTLAIKNNIKNKEFVLAKELPEYVKGFNYIDKERRSMLVYFDNQILQYSIDGDSIVNGFAFYGDNQTNKDDTVTIEKIEGKYILLNSAGHHFLFNRDFSKYYDLKKALNDSVSTIMNLVSSYSSKVINIEFHLHNRTVKQKINIDTLKLNDRKEYLKIFGMH